MKTDNKYIGHIHSDAEIEMDLDEGVIKMEYSSKSTFYNSNSMINDSKLKHHTVWYLLYSVFTPVPLIFLRVISLNVAVVIQKLFPKTWKKYNLQYKYQNFLKNNAYCLDGIVTEIFESPLSSNTLTIPIRANLYVEYQLFEDYQLYIKKVSLKRKIVQVETPVEIITIHQGWNLLLEFSQIPQSGKVIVKYIY